MATAGVPVSVPGPGAPAAVAVAAEGGGGCRDCCCCCCSAARSTGRMMGGGGAGPRPRLSVPLPPPPPPPPPPPAWWLWLLAPSFACGWCVWARGRTQAGRPSRGGVGRARSKSLALLCLAWAELKALRPAYLCMRSKCVSGVSIDSNPSQCMKQKSVSASASKAIARSILFHWMTVDAAGCLAYSCRRSRSIVPINQCRHQQRVHILSDPPTNLNHPPVYLAQAWRVWVQAAAPLNVQCGPSPKTAAAADTELGGKSGVGSCGLVEIDRSSGLARWDGRRVLVGMGGRPAAAADLEGGVVLEGGWG